VEKLASYADKVEKRWVKFIVSAHVWERISQVARTLGIDAEDAEAQARQDCSNDE